MTVDMPRKDMHYKALIAIVLHFSLVPYVAHINLIQTKPFLFWNVTQNIFAMILSCIQPFYLGPNDSNCARAY
jgi:hypothetical protein